MGRSGESFSARTELLTRWPVALDLRKGRCKKWMPGLVPYCLWPNQPRLPISSNWMPDPVTYKHYHFISYLREDKRWHFHLCGCWQFSLSIHQVLVSKISQDDFVALGLGFEVQSN